MAGRIVDPRRLWGCLRSSRTDAAVALSTALAAVFAGIEFALLAGIATSLLGRGLRARAPAGRPPAPRGRRARPGQTLPAEEVTTALGAIGERGKHERISA